MDKPEWEYFIDSAYYDMYCVRNVKDKNFGRTIHVPNKEQAEFLCNELNRIKAILEPELIQGE